MTTDDSSDEDLLAVVPQGDKQEAEGNDNIQIIGAGDVTISQVTTQFAKDKPILAFVLLLLILLGIGVILWLPLTALGFVEPGQLVLIDRVTETPTLSIQNTLQPTPEPSTSPVILTVPPTLVPSPIAPTLIPPTETLPTSTSIPPTDTPTEMPTNTPTPIPPTNTPVPPTNTPTPDAFPWELEIIGYWTFVIFTNGETEIIQESGGATITIRYDSVRFFENAIFDICATQSIDLGLEPLVSSSCQQGTYNFIGPSLIEVNVVDENGQNQYTQMSINISEGKLTLFFEGEEYNPIFTK